MAIPELAIFRRLSGYARVSVVLGLEAITPALSSSYAAISPKVIPTSASTPQPITSASISTTRRSSCFKSSTTRLLTVSSRA